MRLAVRGKFFKAICAAAKVRGSDAGLNLKSRDSKNGDVGPKCYNLNGIWDLKP